MNTLAVDLRGDFVTIAEVGTLFYREIANLPQFSKGIGSNADIVQRTGLESTIVKVKSGRELLFTKSKK